MSTIPPGWYKDPADPATQRWWDGEGWLGDPLPADAVPPDGPPAPTAPPVVTAPASPAPAPVDSAAGAAGVPAGPYDAGSGEVGAVQWPASHRYPMVAPRPHGLLLARPGARFMARVVDALVVLLLAAVANVYFAIEFWRTLPAVTTWAMTAPLNLENPPQQLERATQLLVYMGFVLTAVWFAYEVPSSANTGQTLGKRIFGIKVVRIEADERLGFGRSFRRWLRVAWPTPFWVACYGLPILLQVIDCVFVATDRVLHQALHDRLAQTVVVQVPRAGRPETARTTADAASSDPAAHRRDSSVTGGDNAHPR